jgi:hypothetical protein
MTSKGKSRVRSKKRWLIEADYMSSNARGLSDLFTEPSAHRCTEISGRLPPDINRYAVATLEEARVFRCGPLLLEEIGVA